MKQERFEALVARLEQDAKRAPRAYSFKVVALAALGSAYVLAVLLLIAFLMLMLLVSIATLKAIAVKLIVVLGGFLWMLLKALWVRIEPPTGTPVTAREAPELFAMICTLRRQLGAPRFHHVLVTDDFNAAVVQSPRLGVFGWYRNYLLIGLPLMKALTVEQFQAVLAHEFGHLARGHGRVSNWVYCQRLRWARLLVMLERTQSKGGFLFRPFLNWFAPYFHAYSFPMARANEYEADATSTRLASPRAAAQALTAVNVVGAYLAERYWPQIHQQADDLPHPSFAPYVGMTASVAGELDPVSAQTWLERALARRTDSADTHPALADRLQAIGQAAELALPAAEGAADGLLGTARATLTAHFDRQWHERVLPSWEARHREIQDGRKRLAELDAQANGGVELSLPEALERARLTESIGKDADAALEQFRRAHQGVPDDALACYSLGARLLARDDAAGQPLLERAMQRDADAIAPGCELLRDFHWRQGRQDEAHAWHRRLAERNGVLGAAAAERDQVSLKDKFERHGLPDAAIAELRQRLRAVPGLLRAYYVKKRVAHLSERPCYVLGFSVTPFYRLYSKKRVQTAMQAIQASITFPGESILLCVDGANYRFGRKLWWMRGARIV